MSGLSISRRELIGKLFRSDPIDGARKIAIGYGGISGFDTPHWLTIKRGKVGMLIQVMTQKSETTVRVQPRIFVDGFRPTTSNLIFAHFYSSTMLGKSFTVKGSLRFWR